MIVKSNIRNYEVIQNDDLNILYKVTHLENSAFVIDKNVYNLYKNYFSEISEETLIVIEALEENKTIDIALKICEKITEFPSKRNTTLVAIGGGIIQDIVGFVANIMYRGIRWIFIPTTLLSACDSCIGGKTSLNYKKYKNLLGTFYPPYNIYICPQLFFTLTHKDFESGLGEVIKFNIMTGEKGLEDIETNLPLLLDRNIQVVNSFVEKSLMFKKSFIEEDEFDNGERIKLNFAHTFGHAIEVVSEYKIPHGTAVAIGMIMANYISNFRKWLSEDIKNRSEAVLLRVIDVDVTLLNKSVEKYIEVIKKDKKQIGNSLTAVLISSYGEKAELSVVHDISETEVKKAVEYFIDLYRSIK